MLARQQADSSLGGLAKLAPFFFYLPFFFISPYGLPGFLAIGMGGGLRLGPS